MDEIVILLAFVYAFIAFCLGSWFLGRAKRFSLRDLFVVVTVVAVLLTLIMILKPSVQ
jgi:hypothetical protein